MHFSLIYWNGFLSSIQIYLPGKVGLQYIFQYSKRVKLILYINIKVLWSLCWNALDLILQNLFFYFFISNLLYSLFSNQFPKSHLKLNLRIVVYLQWQYFGEYICISFDIIIEQEMEFNLLLIIALIMRYFELFEQDW